MRKYIREVTAFLLAAVLFFTISWKLGQLLMPIRTVYGSDWEAYLQEEPDSHDILFFGSSLVYCDVIPAILWEETGLTATTLHARAEDAARMQAHREVYDAAVSRAVANVSTLCEITLPFVRVGGTTIAWKGPGVQDEMTAAKRAAFVLGATVRGVEPAPVPRRDDWAHCLLVTDKTGKTPKVYPRKAGTPGKKPLGK